MLKHFQQQIRQLVQDGDKIILAVSGGIDSVVLCHLMAKTQVSFAIAHCNFKLRAEDSDGDARFVRKLAGQFQVPFYETAFDTTSHVEKSKGSVQMVARDLRYDWLEKIRSK